MEHSKKEIIEVRNFIKDSIKWLVKEDCGCCIHKLGDKIGIVVGWMPGYDEDITDGDIHSKEDPSYCINVGLGVYTSDYMNTDMEYINQPYNNETGDVWDTYCTMSANYTNESIETDVKWLLKEYDEMCKYNIDEDGIILGLKEE